MENIETVRLSMKGNQPSPDRIARANEEVARSNIRQSIERMAGDQISQMGTLADATHLLLYGVASLVAKLSSAQSLAEVRAAAEPFAALSGAFLAKVDSGEVKLPFMAKDFNLVVADIEQRASAVAIVLAPAPALASNEQEAL